MWRHCKEITVIIYGQKSLNSIPSSPRQHTISIDSILTSVLLNESHVRALLSLSHVRIMRRLRFYVNFYKEMEN